MRGVSMRGVALVELLVAISMFTLVMGLCLFAAVSGFRMFGQTNIRYQLQRDTGAIFAWLRRDIESTNLLKTQVLKRTSGDNNRDCLGIVSLGSWQEPIDVTPTGEPNWNRLVVYTATRDPEAGQLVRQVHEPNPGAVPINAAYLSSFLPGILDGSVQVFDQRRLAGGIAEFEVTRSIDNESLHFRLKLSQKAVEAGAGRPRAEVLEVETAIHPRNTIPRI